MRTPAPLSSHLISPTVLTNKQRQLWVGQQLYGPLPMYNTPYTFEMFGELHPEYFQHAFQLLINSCDVFRTIIREIHGAPEPMLLSSLSYSMEYCDYAHTQDSEQVVQTWIQNRMKRVFELSDCLFDTALIRVSSTKWIWFYNVHHLISDGLTVSLMFNRMSEFYGQSLTGTLREQVTQPQYQRYAEWESAFSQSARHKNAETYWTTKLQAPLTPLRLYDHKLDCQVVPIQRVTYALDPSLSESIRLVAESFAHPHSPTHSTFFEIFAALFIAYLFRISGNRHLSIGIPFHGRPAGPFKTTLGLFVEIAPLMIDVAQTETFETLRKKIHEELHAVSRHFRSTPACRLEERPYHVQLNYHLASFPNFQEIPVKTTWHHIGMADVGLTFNIQDFNQRGSFTFDLDIDAEHFDGTQRQRILKHILSLLHACLKDPSQPLGKCTLLSDGEHLSGVDESHASQNNFHLQQAEDSIDSSTQGIAHLFEAQVEQAPDAVAIVSHDQQLTYAYLDRQANQLAHFLRRQGVIPEERVGLCLERGVDFIVSILAILKVGAAYVPLDPTAPLERLTTIMGNAHVRVVLVHMLHWEALRATTKQVFALDGMRATLLKEPTASIGLPVCDAQLGYIMYTSGSTGQAKGILISQRSIVRLVKATNYVKLNERDCVGHLANVSMDASTFEIWGALLNGGHIVVFSQEEVLNPFTCALQIQQHGITCMFLTTALFNQLVREAPTAFASVRTVLFGGEMVDRYAVESVMTAAPPSQLVHVYGPTESTTFATWHSIKTIDCNREAIPIGRPVNNTCVYAVDQSQQLAPVGVPGELLIGGDGLAWGYLMQPALTAEMFIPHPWSHVPGARLYRSGDIIRYGLNEAIEFKGRRDDQIKLRGYRIELGEIQKVLRQHPKVREAVVLCREDNQKEKHLVAYVMISQEPTAVEELRSFMRKLLPEYMVPSAFVMLDKFPLTSNGKIDKCVLQPPDNGDLTRGMHYVAPRTILEELIVEVWQEVLQVEQLGILDNFFDAGGHSLLAIQVIARLRNELDLDVPIRTLFDHPTILHFAEEIHRLLPDLILDEVECQA